MSWSYGWDDEPFQAWRSHFGSISKEAAVKVYKAEQSVVTDLIWAEWAHGHQRQVAGITCDMFDGFGGGTNRTAGTMWEGKHADANTSPDKNAQVELRMPSFAYVW